MKESELHAGEKETEAYKKTVEERKQNEYWWSEKSEKLYDTDEYREELRQRRKKYWYETAVRNFISGTLPKRFRVWDLLHWRWFQGGTDETKRNLDTDCVNYFGEVLSFVGTTADQNGPTDWKKSLKDGEIKSSLEIPNYLVVMQGLGVKDSHGWEIFEGDIVKARTVYGENKVGFIRIIKNNEVRHEWLPRYVLAYPASNSKTEYYDLDITSPRQITILGNLFETPSLVYPEGYLDKYRCDMTKLYKKDWKGIKHDD